MLSEASTNALEQTVSGYFKMNRNNGEEGFGNAPVLVVADDPQKRLEYCQVIEMAGHRVDGGSDLMSAPDRLERQLTTTAIVVHLDNADQQTHDILARIENGRHNGDIPLILILHVNLLDAIIPQNNDENVEYILLDDQPRQTDLLAEIIVSLPYRVKKSREMVFEERGDLELGDLKKISADVERISRTLAKLTEQDSFPSNEGLANSPYIGSAIEPTGSSNVADAPVSFKAQNREPLQSFGSLDITSAVQPQNGGQNSYNISAKHIRDLIRARRLRDQYFNAELFADPAWDMLLDLMAARLENVQVSVSSLCIAASVPPTTALRWIKTMTDENIFVRQADEKDGRRIFITLSDEAVEAMTNFFAMIRRDGLMLV